MSQSVNNLWGQLFGQGMQQLANIVEQHEANINQMQGNFVNIGREVKGGRQPGCDCTGCKMIDRLLVADDGVRLTPEMPTPPAPQGNSTPPATNAKKAEPVKAGS